MGIEIEYWHTSSSATFAWLNVSPMNNEKRLPSCYVKLAITHATRDRSEAQVKLCCRFRMGLISHANYLLIERPRGVMEAVIPSH